MSIRLIMTFFIIAASQVIAASPSPQVYRNEEFGIEFPIPNGAQRCPVPKDERDHGPVFILGSTSPVGSVDLKHSRSIVIFAGANAEDTTKKLHDYLAHEVELLGKDTRRKKLRNLQIAGFACESARVDRSDGWIDIIVVTQAGKPDLAFDPSVPSINYFFGLHTTAGDLEVDLKSFRAILEKIRLSPP